MRTLGRGAQRGYDSCAAFAARERYSLAGMSSRANETRESSPPEPLCDEATREARAGVPEQERHAAADSTPPPPTPTLGVSYAREPLAMLVRRGFHPTVAPLDVPFDPDRNDIDRVVDALDRYAHRLFLRGAIQRPHGFAPAECTRYLTAGAATRAAQDFHALSLLRALESPPGHYALVRRARSFGGTLEWLVAYELRRRFALDAVAGVKFHAPGVGGDLDVVACAEGRLVVLELKSSPPKHLGDEEVAAFVQRTRALRPHVAIFAMDTALRLEDKVLPMLCAHAKREGGPELRPRRVHGEVYALGPHAYLVNARPSLVLNIGRAVAEGFAALSPDPFAPWP